MNFINKEPALNINHATEYPDKHWDDYRKFVA